MDYTQIAVSIGAGLLGGFIYCLVWKFGWKERQEYFEHLSFGAIAGLLTWGTMYVAEKIPQDNVWLMLAIVPVGFMGIDVVMAFINKYIRPVPPPVKP